MSERREKKSKRSRREKEKAKEEEEEDEWVESVPAKKKSTSTSASIPASTSTSAPASASASASTSKDTDNQFDSLISSTSTSTSKLSPSDRAPASNHISFQSHSAYEQDASFLALSTHISPSEEPDDLPPAGPSAAHQKKLQSRAEASKLSDFRRTMRALEACDFCFQGENSELPPRCNVVSSGSVVFLAIPNSQLVPGHVMIVPLQHHLSILACDEDEWLEIQNFMKCLLRLHAGDVVFFSTVLDISKQRHAVIEAVPMTRSAMGQVSGYFRQGLSEVGSEWNQNRKLIPFSSAKPLKSALVPDLESFWISWDHKGHTGWGHMIEVNKRSSRENTNNNDGAYDDDEAEAMEHATAGGDTQFTATFAHAILADLLKLPMSSWRKPRRNDRAFDKERCLKYINSGWGKVDWTLALTQPDA